jgi:uncharacterized protein DUF4345
MAQADVGKPDLGEALATRPLLDQQRLASLLAFLGVTQLALGALMAIAPGTFFDAIADYGTRNDHYLRDISTFYLALGAVLLAAAKRPQWRIPVLAFASLQYALHSINHLIDIGNGDPGWIGPLNFLSLVLFTALLVYALRAAALSR